MTDKILVLTTAPDEAQAGRIAAALVDRRLAACVAVTPGVTSVYRWQGKVETAGEWALTIKTRAALYGAVEAAIRELHSYEVPEILAVPVVAGSRAYLDWVEAETAVAGGSGDVMG